MKPFDDMFDFNRDGKLDDWERAAEFGFLMQMMEDKAERETAEDDI